MMGKRWSHRAAAALAATCTLANASTFAQDAAPANSPPPVVGMQAARSAPPLAKAAERPNTVAPKTGEWSKSYLRTMQERIPVPVFVKLAPPAGAKAAFYTAEATPIGFDGPAVVGLRSRHRYAFSLTGLSVKPTQSYFGTVEVMLGPKLPDNLQGPDRPIPIHFTDRDVLALGAAGMVTKVICVENPDSAVPVETGANETLTIDALDNEDPLEVAKRHGRIFLIVRIGDRRLDKDEIVGATSAGNFLAISASGRRAQANGEKVTLAHFEQVGTPDGAVEQAGFWGNRNKGCDNCNNCGSAYTKPPLAGLSGGSGDCATCDSCRSRSRGTRDWGYGPRSTNGYFAVRPTPGFAPEAPAFGGATPQPFDEPYDDEYVCDGGDRQPKATFETAGSGLRNLQGGDTVARYRDKQGKNRLTESTVACVYAPRFVEIRAVQAPDAYERWDLARRLVLSDFSLSVKGTNQTNERLMVETSEHVLARQRASGVVGKFYAGVFSEVRVLSGFDGTKLHHIDKTAVGDLWLKNHEQLFVARLVDYARSISLVDYPIAIAGTQAHGQVLGAWAKFELRHIEEKVGKPARLKLEKTADKADAQPGDTVTFVIKFTNVGDETLTNLAVVDSLPRRLEYVEGSATSSADAVFTAEDNEHGSKTLRWEVKPAVKGKASGTVQFKARIR